MSTIGVNDVEELISSLETTASKLTAADRKKLAALIRSMGATIVALNDQVFELTLSLRICDDATTAAAAARSGLLAGLRGIAPPAASINVDDAVAEAAKLRKEIETANDLTRWIVAGAKFAVKIAGKFI